MIAKSEPSVRFDLEQNLISSWGLVDELQSIVEDSSNLSHQEIVDLIRSLTVIYRRKFDKTFTTFEQYIQEVHENERRFCGTK